MDGASEKDILEEITEGGLPSNVTAEIVRDAPALPVDPDALHDHLGNPLCGEYYKARGQRFPDRCSLPKAHAQKGPAANHWNGAIGWWV